MMQPQTSSKIARRAARDQLITEYLPMARRIARKVARRTPGHVQADDLMAAALVGLTEAADRFDASRGEPFVAFASMRVRGAVLDELRRGDVLPRRVRQKARKMADAVSTLEKKLGRSPEEHEVAGALGVACPRELSEIAELGRVRVIGLDGDSGAAMNVSCGSESPAAAAERAELTALVRAGLASLPERDIKILSLYYFEGFSYIEIGQILGVSESRICQLHSRALGRLRDGLKHAA